MLFRSVDVGESIGFIEIPKIDVYLPVYSGTGEDVLQKGVGHLAESSYPIGGTSTHSVLTGHRGLPSAVLFTDPFSTLKDVSSLKSVPLLLIRTFFRVVPSVGFTSVIS